MTNLKSRHAAGAALSVLVVMSCAGAQSAEQVGQATLQRAAMASYAPGFSFQHRPDSERLQACFSARRSVFARVDSSAALAAFRVESDGPDIAFLAGGTVYLSAAILPGWGIPTAWVAVSGEAPASNRAALSTTLGPDLAGYVLLGSLPEPPSVLARAALEAKATARQTTVAGSTPIMVRLDLEIDSAQLDDQAMQAGSASRSPGDDVRVTLWLDELSRVTRLDARLAGPATATSDEAFGYQVDFQIGAPPEVALPDGASVTALDDSAVPANPAPPRLECGIGS